MTRRQALSLLALGSILTLLGVGPAAAATRSATGRYCGEQRLYGYVRSLTKSGNRYLLRFDPAFFLSGKTANQAAARDGVVAKGEPVPNDNYVVNESRRTYVYTLTGATRIRVLLKGGDITKGSRVSAATLAQLVRGRHPVTLFEGLDSGFWLGVHIDQACSLSQQYHP